MKTMKKVLLLVTSLCFTGALVACGGGNKGNNDGGNGGGNISGETVANKAAWTQALTDSALATNATVSMTIKGEDRMGEFYEKGESSVTAKIANGKVYVYEKTDASWYFEEDGIVERDEEHDEDQTYLATIDGVTMEYFKELEQDWQISEWYQEDFSATLGFVLDWQADFSLTDVSEMYELFTNDNGTYSCTLEMEEDISTAQIKFVDGKVAWGKITMAGTYEGGATSTWEASFTITYGNTTIGALPGQEEKPDSGNSSGGGSSASESGSDGKESDNVELPDTSVEIPDVDGEEVKDLAAWNAAWQKTIAARNLTAVYTSTYTTEEGKTETEYGVGIIADGKQYAYDYDDTNGYAYMYLGEVDGKVYQWTSTDGENWDVEEEYLDIDLMTSGYMIVRGLNEMLDFSTAKYEKGYYVCTTDWATFRIKIADGYVVEIEMSDESEVMSYKMSFGGAEVGELPPLPQEEIIIGEEIKSTGDWADVLANTDEQTNFTYTASGRIYRDDGKTSIMTEYVAVDNGKVYVERESMVHSGSGSASGMVATYYQGIVGGVAYEWRDIGGDEWYVNQIAAIDNTGIVDLLGLGDLDFATAKFNSETGAYTFDADGAVISVRAVKGLILAAELITDTMEVEYRFVYGNASVELPPMDGSMGDGGNGGDVIVPELDWDETLGDDIIGEEVSEEEFANAIKKTYASTNFAVKGCANDDYGTGVGITYIADGKMYNYTESLHITQDGSKEKEQFAMYMGMVDGVEYAWVSSNGGPWESGSAEDIGLSGLTNGMVFQMYLSYADYNKAVFDAKTGAYLVDVAADDETVTVSIKIVDGYVGAFSLIYADMIQTFVIEYGTAYVGELPPVSGGGSTGGGSNTDEPSNDEWDLAFENLLSGRNYSMKQIQDVAYYDGSKRMEHVSGSKLTEYAIEEESELRTSDEEGDHIERERNVWTNENGVNYEYTYNMETGIWEKAESSNTVEDLFQNMHSMFSVFAKMYDAMEWNANDGCFYAAEFSMGANALYNVQIVIENGNVQRISYDMRYDEYEGTMRIDLYDYECTEVTIPTEGQGDSGNGDNSGDVEIGGDVEIPVVGGETTIKALYAAIENTRKENNLQANVIYGTYMIENETPTLLESGEGLIAFCDNKQYTETTVFSADGTSQTRYTYCGNIDGKNYV